MEATVTDADTLRKRISLTWTKDEVLIRRNGLLLRYADRIKLKGFRPGHTPKDVLEKRFGATAEAEAVEVLISEGLQKVVEEHRLQIIGPLDVEESSREDGLKHVVSSDIRPDCSLPDPAHIAIPVEEVTPGDAEVDTEIDRLRLRAGDLADLEATETLASGDIITLSGTVTAGEETVREVHDLQHIVGSYPLLGKNPEEMVAICVTLKIGEILAFDTILPDNFTPEEWAGKQAAISLTVQSAQRPRAADLDQAFCQRLGVPDEATLRERLVAMLTQQKADNLRQRQTEAMLDRLVQVCEFSLPTRFVNRLVDEELQRRQQQQDGETTIDADAVRAELIKDFRRSIIVDIIAEQLEVKTTRADIDQQVQMAAYRSGRQPKEVEKQLRDSGRIMDVAHEIRSSKAVDAFLDKILKAGPTPLETGDAPEKSPAKPKAGKKSAQKPDATPADPPAADVAEPAKVRPITKTKSPTATKKSADKTTVDKTAAAKKKPTKTRKRTEKS